MTQYANLEIREFDTSTLSGSFQNVGAVLSNGAKFVYIFNTSTVDVYLTTDNSTNMIRIPASKDMPIIPFPFYGRQIESAFIFPNKTQLKAKQVTGAAAGALIVNLYS